VSSPQASGLGLHILLAAPLLVVAACQQAPAAATLPSTGIERITDPTGRYQTTTRGVRNFLLTWTSEPDSGVFSVLEERSETRCCDRGSEHPTATTITLTRVDRDPDGTLSRPWTHTGSFDEGDLWWDSYRRTPYYRGTEWGCCDANDLQTLVNALTGTTVLHYSKEWEPGGETPTQLVSTGGEQRFFGFVESYQFEDRDSLLRRSAFGLIEVTDGTAPARRWSVIAPSNAGVRFGSLRLVLAGRSGPGERILSGSSLARPLAKDLSGFDLLLALPAYEDADVTIRIPIRGGDLVPQAASMPKEWRIQRLP
jgi:hypothetical protein